MSHTKTKLKLKPEPVSDEVITPMNNTELLPFGTGTKLLRLDIPLTNEFLEVVTELCKIKEWDLKRYVSEALHDAVELDLTSPTEIGLDVCKSLKEIIHPEGAT
jgi:hypothetical protein